MLDSNPPEQMVRVLDITKGGEGAILQPTLRFREVVHIEVSGTVNIRDPSRSFSIPHPVTRIQQLWMDEKLGVGEWRDIERVIEGHGQPLIPNPAPYIP